MSMSSPAASGLIDLTTLEVSEVVGKIQSHEMFLLGDIDPPQAKKDLTLKAKSGHKSKKKNKSKAPSPSSSDDEVSEESRLVSLIHAVVDGL